MEEPHDTFYGMHELIVRDPNGFWITFAEDSAFGKLMNAMHAGNLDEVKAALDRGGIKSESLTNALMFVTSAEHRNDEIADLLRNAGATLPPKINLQTLQMYTGRYRSDVGPSVEMSIKDGQLCALVGDEDQVNLIPIDQTSFRPTFLDHIKVTFKVEEGNAVGFEFQEGQEISQYIRVNK